MPGLKMSNTRRSDSPRSMITPMAVNSVMAGTPRNSAHSSQWRVSSIRVSPTSKQTARIGMNGERVLGNSRSAWSRGPGLATAPGNGSGLLCQSRADFVRQARDGEQIGGGRGVRMAAALFPVLQRRQRDAEGLGEDKL